MKIAIIGSGVLAQHITHYAEVDLSYDVVGYFNDFIEINTLVNNLPVLGKVSDILTKYKNGEFDALVIGIGYKHFEFRASVFEEYKGVIPFANIIHPSCYLDSSVVLGEGVVLFPKSILDVNVNVGDNVLINIGCVIAHDTSIAKHSFLSPGVTLAGFINIGEKCNIGINTTIIDNITVCNETQTGGGTVVIKNIVKKGLYVGNPQRFIK
ncbi:acetyltransferase [Bacteroidota bacterium]